MKNAMCLLMCLLICLCMAAPAFAVADDHALVIGYKDAPNIVAAEQDDEDVKGCLVVTSVRAAREKTTDMTQEERDELLAIYDELMDGSMKLPLEKDYLIWDLADVSYQKTGCRDQEEHDHEEWLEQENTEVTITFDSGIAKDAEVEVLTYMSGAWAPVEKVTNNDDGTVTCVFEDICPVVFCLPYEKQGDDTSDDNQTDDFVPSVGPNDGPGIVGGEQDDGRMERCLVVTSLKAAKEKTTDITQEERDELLAVYDKLLDGSMKLPLAEDDVIRELVDVSWKKTICRDEDHGHKEWLERENTTVTVIFDLGVAEDTEMKVLTYVDGEWTPAKEVINYGDGTVICIFEDICPVAFCVSPEK